MRSSKIMVIVTTAFAVFGIGHVRALIAHGQFGCAVAAALNPGTTAARRPTMPLQNLTRRLRHPTLPVSGKANWKIPYSAVIQLLWGSIQNGNKLSGQWSSAVDLAATTLKGSIDGNGDLKMTLKAGRGGCHLAAVGQLVTETEIMMTYKVVSCKGIKKTTAPSIYPRSLKL